MGAGADLLGAGVPPALVARAAQAIVKVSERVVDDENFDWSSDDSVVLNDRPSTAIYHNKYGQIVIRQEATWNADEDHTLLL